jgi:hypothetical protein
MSETFTISLRLNPIDNTPIEWLDLLVVDNIIAFVHVEEYEGEEITTQFELEMKDFDRFVECLYELKRAIEPPPVETIENSLENLFGSD